MKTMELLVFDITATIHSLDEIFKCEVIERMKQNVVSTTKIEFERHLIRLHNNELIILPFLGIQSKTHENNNHTQQRETNINTNTNKNKDNSNYLEISFKGGSGFYKLFCEDTNICTTFNNQSIQFDSLCLHFFFIFFMCVNMCDCLMCICVCVCVNVGICGYIKSLFKAIKGRGVREVSWK